MFVRLLRDHTGGLYRSRNFQLALMRAVFYTHPDVVTVTGIRVPFLSLSHKIIIVIFRHTELNSKLTIGILFGGGAIFIDT